MKKVRTQTKRSLPILLALLMLAVSLPLAFAQGTTYQTGDHIQYGTYPQTRVDETDALQAAASAATWKSYGYSTNSQQTVSEDCWKFADFFCGNEKYRAVEFAQERSSGGSGGYSTSNGFAPNTIHYFQYEPLTWRVLDAAAGFIMCESLIDAQEYFRFYSFNNDTTRDYANSFIRNWLNNDFFETAFTNAQKANIKSTSVTYQTPDSESVDDKVFLLSFEDVTTSAFGFSSDRYTQSSTAEDDTGRRAQGTDYAECQGLYVYYPTASAGSWWAAAYGNSVWYLRDTKYVNWNGSASNNSDTGYYCYYGIRPACCLHELSSNTALSPGLFSADLHEHTYTSAVTTPATCKTEGVMTYTCTCGDSYTEPIAVDLNAHGALNENGDCTLCGTHVKDVEKPAEPQSEEPTTQQQQQGGNCKYCGGTHTGFPGVLIGIIHSLLALFGLHK